MKRSFKIVTLFLLFAVSANNAFSQAVKYFGNVDIKASVVYDPGFTGPNVKLVPVKKSLQWIQFDIDYQAVAKTNKTTKSIAWLDDVTMKYDILLPQVPGKPRVVLSGKVEYWALPLDGETHHAQVFIHPQILKRYVPDLKLTKGKLKELRLRLTFEMNESPVGVGVMKAKASTNESEVYKEIQKALLSPSTLKVKDAIYNRNETPWGIINLSYYELIKRKN